MAKKINKKKKIASKKKVIKKVSKKISKTKAFKRAGKRVVRKIVKKVSNVSQKAMALPEISKETFDYFMAKLDAI